MPWKETDIVKERVEFLLEWETRWGAGEGFLNDWLGRYREQRDLRAAESRSCRPLTSPTKVSEELEDFIVLARKRHPTWGPKKLRAWVANNNPHVVLPATSTIGDILSRRGMTQRRLRKRRGTKEARQPFADVTGPNATWCADR